MKIKKHAPKLPTHVVTVDFTADELAEIVYLMGKACGGNYGMFEELLDAWRSLPGKANKFPPCPDNMLED